METPAVLRVATLNIRNTSDRWHARRQLLVRQFVELEPDLFGVQEVRRIPRQAAWIAREVNARVEQPYVYRANWKTGIMGWREGIAIFSRLPILRHDELDLRGGYRVAQRLVARTRDGAELVFCNTHLHHALKPTDIRLRQASRILAWLADDQAAPVVLVGDFNAPPTDPTIAAITERLRSVYFAVHAREPERTVPTPLSRRDDSEGQVIDFIFANDRIVVHRAWRTFEEPDADDATLTASDHYGLAADISVRP